MASRLRPTPEIGRVAATRQPASEIGPSWAQRGSREARLAFRQAQRRNDREGAMDIAEKASQRGLSSNATIGSAEERLAGQYQGRQADAAVVSEIGGALTPPAVVQPPIPEAPAVPGASQPPENPVSGTSVPVTGDAESRLGKSRVDPLTGKPIGYDPRNPSPVDTMSRIRELTSAGGDNLTRGDAVRKINDERRAAGRAALDYDQTIDELQAADREAEQTKRTGAALNRGPTLSADPVLARSFRTPARGTAPATPPTAPQVRAPQSAADRFSRPPYNTSMRAAPEPLDLVDLRERQAKELKRRIKIPEWQEGTILGRLNRSVRESLIDAGRAGKPTR